MWLHKHYKHWELSLSEHGLGDHLQHGKQYSNSEVDMLRTFPSVSASSHGLCFPLATWPIAPQRRCGMGSHENRGACSSVLRSIVSVLFADSWDLKIFVCDKSVWEWPRHRQGSCPIELEVVARGVASLRRLHDAWSNGRPEGSGAMAKFLLRHFGGAQKIMFTEMLAAANKGGIDD